MCAVPAGPKIFGMRKELDPRPWQWLAASQIPITDVAGVLATFRPGTARVVCFSGPHTLYRAAGWRLKNGKPERVSAYGGWWADAAVLAGIGAPQPQHSGLDPKLGSTPILRGGAEQIFFKKTLKLNSINPLRVHSDRLP